VYTREFAKYLEEHGKEDPRVLESFDTTDKRAAVRINYLKNSELYNYFWSATNDKTWNRGSEVFYSSEKTVQGLTRNLNSPGIYYDTVTHEYLGEYLRFLRDYHNVNLMSMYNCFNDKIYNNIYFPFSIGADTLHQRKTIFNSQDANYRIYAIPVKLFANYTIAVDSNQGIEMFCGLYSTMLDVSDKAKILAAKTYTKVNKTLFNQPILYDKLDVNNWAIENELVFSRAQKGPTQIRTDIFTRWDLAMREKDLKLFIKVPASCRSSITILEGDYRNFNNFNYKLVGSEWEYCQNSSILNFDSKRDLNNYSFKPISKLQLLAFNTGESYPFADRLIEYLSGSAITPLDEIPDNIKRAQKVMEQNKSYFEIEGLWEDKMQNILYDYMMNAGDIVVDQESVEPIKPLKDKRQGYHRKLGHTCKSTLYDVLGYVDKDAEKWYASWENKGGKAQIKDSIQNVDIYDGVFDIK
jgi:hypothetical protein